MRRSSRIRYVRSITSKVEMAIQVWRIAFHDKQAITEILYEQADSQFPRDAKGRIDWSFGTVDIATDNA